MSTSRHPRVYWIWALLLGIDVAVQVGMKLAGDQLGSVPFGTQWLVAALSSWQVWFSLAGYAATFVLWLAILHASSLSAAFPVTALTYILVPLCGWLLLGETLSAGQAAGVSLILAGVLLQRDAAR